MSPSYPLHFFIIHLPMWLLSPSSISEFQTLDSSMLTLSYLRYRVLYLELVTIVAGLFQALLVFNLSYVQRLSLRLDLLYQYQAIVSKAPRNQYTTNSSTCELSILRPIA